MPIPENRLHQSARLNRWFAVSSVLMTASIVWMIVVDYQRPWIEFQDDYSVAKAAMAHFDYLDSVRQEKQKEIELARHRLEDAKQLHEQTASGTRKLVAAQLAEADLNFRKAKASWSQKDQVLQVTSAHFEETRNEFGPDSSRTRAAQTHLEEGQNEVAALRKEKEHWEDEKNRLQAELKRLEEPVKAAQKRLEELMQSAEAAAEKDRQYRGVLTDEGILAGIPVVSALINAPLLDFTAPKNTPSRRQVNQLVLPNVRQQLNYLESYTTDRCTTCHVAIDEPEFSVDRLAVKLEESLPGISEELQRRGGSPLVFPAPPVLEAPDVPPLKPGEVTDHWAELSEPQRRAYFADLVKVVNEYLEESGRKTLHLAQPLLAHPKLDLYVAVDSPHPKKDFGCTVCHEGNPQETDFVLASHSAPTHKIEDEWKEKYYTSFLGLPTITFETVAHFWDRPMFLPRHSEAGCTKCHTDIADIDRFEGRREGAKINQGRHLFASLGCVNCHNVDALAGARKVAPDLTFVGAKLTPGFIQQWVFFPQKFRPSTRMPHLFLQENNRAESKNTHDADPVLRTEAEVAAMTKYILAVSKEWRPLALPEGVQGDVERGRTLFRQVGCAACHSNLSEYGEEWVTKDLAVRRGTDVQMAGYQYKGMTPEERARYALENFPDEQVSFLSPEAVRFDPEKPYTKPTFTRFAPELSGIGSKVTFEWLYSWLLDPTHYAPDTKMPSLRLKPDEAADLAAYLMTQRNDAFVPREFELDAKRRQMVDELILTVLQAQRSARHSRAVLNDEGGELTQMLIAGLKSSFGQEAAETLVRPMPLPDKKLTFLGSKMIAHYGCYACHRIRGFEETTPPGTDLSKWAEKPLAQLDFAFFDDAFHHVRKAKPEVFGYLYLPNDDLMNYWSPGENPKEEITHTHAAFAKHKMLNPRIWDREKIKKPYDKLKMPNFYLTDREAEALTTYLLSRRSPRVAPNMKADDESDTVGPIARGRNLTRELNCIGCHEIEDNVPPIQQYYRRPIAGKLTFDVTNAPPSLWGEGAKIQHHWLHEFLQNVETLRPWLTVRMPSFNLTNEQATILTEYFAALSRKDAENLNKSLTVVDEQLAAMGLTGSAAATNGQETPLETKWYEKESLKRFVARLRRFAVERKLIRPIELDPLRSPPDAVQAAHAKTLDRTRFMRNLYDVPYPFVEPPRTSAGEERFELGSRFINDMGCLKCHVLGEMLPGPAKNTDQFVQTYRLDSVRGEGDQAIAVLNGQTYPVGSVIDGHKLVSATNVYYPSGDVETKAVVEGPNAEGTVERVALQAASAPNLNLTHKRLRRSWVFNWMLQPGWIQPGTKMPMNFPDRKSPYEGDSRYPGTGVDHINLLVDYLYEAGARNVRAPLVTSVIKEGDTFEEEGEAKKQEFFED